MPDSSRNEKARAWLETKDHQRAWDRLVGKRVQTLRLQNGNKIPADKGENSRRRQPRWIPQRTDFSQEAVGARIIRSQSWFSKIERGERSISIGDAYLLAGYLGVDPVCIVGPPTPQEQEKFDIDIASIRKDRKKQGVTAETVARRQGKAKNGRRRAGKLNSNEE